MSHTVYAVNKFNTGVVMECSLTDKQVDDLNSFFGEHFKEVFQQVTDKEVVHILEGDVDLEDYECPKGIASLLPPQKNNLSAEAKSIVGWAYVLLKDNYKLYIQ